MKLGIYPACIAWTLAALSGCATYEADPIDPTQVLERLEAVRWEALSSEASESAPSDAEGIGVGPRQLAAFAVSASPQLAALRAEIGHRAALLVQAGLLPDPEVSWDAMNVVASKLVNQSSSPVDVLSGFGVMFPLLRPDERAARVDAAEWRVEAAKRQVLAAEWMLTRDVHIAYEEVLGAEALLAQTESLSGLAESTYDYFERAREAGAVTAIQANLALGDYQLIRLDKIRATTRVKQAHQALNALLGLSPSTSLKLRLHDERAATSSEADSTDDLVAKAVHGRPDLVALQAEYLAAEEEVRLTFSQQYPLISVGTGISVTLPIFTRSGAPARRTALAVRERLNREFTAAVHRVRQEVAAAAALLELASSEFDLVEQELLPNAERNLDLSQEAFRAGEVTLLETLALQRALVQARTRLTEARAERAKRIWSLLAASGSLLAATPATRSNTEEAAQ